MYYLRFFVVFKNTAEQQWYKNYSFGQAAQHTTKAPSSAPRLATHWQCKELGPRALQGPMALFQLTKKAYHFSFESGIIFRRDCDGTTEE